VKTYFTILHDRIMSPTFSWLSLRAGCDYQIWGGGGRGTNSGGSNNKDSIMSGGGGQRW